MSPNLQHEQVLMLANESDAKIKYLCISQILAHLFRISQVEA